MMELLFLPGYSPHNQAEMDAVSTELEKAGYKVLRHHWQHWITDSGGLDIDKELELITKTVTSISEYAIIAKSIGTLVTVKLMANGTVPTPERVVMCGIPISSLDESDRADYKRVLSGSALRLFVIQNSGDPHGTPDQVKELLQEVKYELIEMDADSHSYSYPEEILSILQDTK